MYADGKIAEATEHYRRAVQLDPENTEARTHLVIALRRLLVINPNLEGIKRELADLERELAADANLRR